jgi:cell wall-associated NlpC family hydrolase
MHFPAHDARSGRVRASIALITMAALAASSAACATSGGVPRPFPGAPVASGAHTPPLAPVAPIEPVAPVTSGDAIAQFAMGFRGVPYRLGGADPTGFDCSGLVQYVFAQYGIAVPRVVEQQYEAGEKIKPSEIRPGDLIFFDTKRWGRGASHVGIAIGPDSFVHAPNSTGVIRVEALGSSYWGPRYVGARRITPSATN